MHNNVQEQPKGAKESIAPESLRINPVLSAILSGLVVGLAQIINGQHVKGAIMMCIAAVVVALCGLPTIIIYWLISAFDAYQCACMLEDGKSLGKYQFIFVYKTSNGAVR